MLKKNKIIFLIISIIIVAFVISLFLNNETKVVPEENIVEQIFEETEYTLKNSDEDILKEIDQKYADIEKKSLSDEYELLPREWQSSGPFSIDRKEYGLGEKIFLIIEGLNFNEKGKISILRPLNQTHYSVWQTYAFDGSVTESFNIYFEPKLQKIFKICDKEDLLGDWVMVFQNTNYENLRFRIVDKIVPGDEEKFNFSVC